MMKLSFFAFFAMAAMACNDAPKTTVRIHAVGTSDDLKPQLETKDSTYSATLDSTSSALFVMAEDLTSGYATITLGRARIPVYVEQGKSFDVDVKFEGRRVKTVFTGEGAKKNQYLNGDVFRQASDFELQENEFLDALDEQLRKLNEHLDSWGFDESFKQMERKRLYFVVYRALLDYPEYLHHYSQNRGLASERFYDKVKSVFVEDESLIDLEVYRTAMKDFVLLVSKTKPYFNALQNLQVQLDYIGQNVKGPLLKEYLVDQIVSVYIERNGIDHLSELKPVYEANVFDAKKKAAFGELCKNWDRIAPGQLSPSFTYEDIDGKEVSLSDLAGKYVYIDNWATWCSPCRGELPALKKLEEKYAGRNIYFVCISCDRDKATWEKMVKEDKLGGIQLHNGGDRAFWNAYRITGIPRFILLDREGRIINADMTRPSDPQTVEFLDALEGI